jgi:hypothetical protein
LGRDKQGLSRVRTSSTTRLALRLVRHRNDASPLPWHEGEQRGLVQAASRSGPPAPHHPGGNLRKERRAIGVQAGHRRCRPKARVQDKSYERAERAKAAVGGAGKMPPAADIQGLELIRLSGFKQASIPVKRSPRSVGNRR